ncbi:hypothetical protein [Cyanobacterium aponinum]|uniref:hypothetical protein n=1 Tax=Cyanobacterium aponinum TaxID=379064 RepID=UPI000C12ADC8|nr:hypothetical protein [Cyanobacterium aponinum]PHV62816.1 hypothetical protein CSQ80_08875 [Cyanobacterium aponinum IPPAS B-1201]
MLGNKVRTFLALMFLTLLGTGIFYLQNSYTSRYIKNELNKVNYVQEEEKLKASLTLQKRFPTFGFNNLLADWQYLQFIQYFGDTTAREKTGYSLVTDYFELISKYDPHFVDAYFILSTANSIYAGQPEKTVALLNKILPNISPKISPDAMFLWIYKGVDEILFLGNIEEAKKSYAKSADWALARGDKDGKIIAERSLETVKFLEGNPDSKKAQVSAWATVLNTAFDDKTREIAIDKIRALGGKVNIDDNGNVNVTLPEQD